MVRLIVTLTWLFQSVYFGLLTRSVMARAIMTAALQLLFSLDRSPLALAM